MTDRARLAIGRPGVARWPVPPGMVGAAMSEALYERYKEALRRGHVASTRSHHAAAIEAYSEAARIAPDRALPLVGLATVLVRLGKPAEALTAFDGALDRAPDDEGALRGRADLLLARGDRSGAADTLDRLAQALDAGRPAGRCHRCGPARPGARRIAQPAALGHGPQRPAARPGRRSRCVRGTDPGPVRARGTSPGPGRRPRPTRCRRRGRPAPGGRRAGADRARTGRPAPALRPGRGDGRGGGHGRGR